MLRAYSSGDGRLRELAPAEPLESAVWIDLLRPEATEMEAVSLFGVTVPTLADMEEIEVSARLYRETGAEYLTVVLPGASETNTPMAGPVTFILTRERLVTVRHHTPKPFDTYPARADKVGVGCGNGDEIFLGLMEEAIGRLADLLENAGRGLNAVSAEVFHNADRSAPDDLRNALRSIGGEGELIGRVRLSLLTLERALTFFEQTQVERHVKSPKPVLKGLTRDVQALEVHADFLSQRVALATDTTLGMINLSQNQTIRILSVVAVVFLPPTLIASIWGMNFHVMPELDWLYGYPVALGVMLASAVGTFLYFRWRDWL